MTAKFIKRNIELVITPEEAGMQFAISNASVQVGFLLGFLAGIDGWDWNAQSLYIARELPFDERIKVAIALETLASFIKEERS